MLPKQEDQLSPDRQWVADRMQLAAALLVGTIKIDEFEESAKEADQRYAEKMIRRLVGYLQ